MSKEQKKKGVPKMQNPPPPPSPRIEVLNERFKRLECIGKVNDIRIAEEKAKLDKSVRRVELLRLRQGESQYNGPVDKLLSIAQAYFIDNDRSVGTEPALRSLWTAEEMETIKGAILEKLKTI